MTARSPPSRVSLSGALCRRLSISLSRFPLRLSYRRFSRPSPLMGPSSSDSGHGPRRYLGTISRSVCCIFGSEHVESPGNRILPLRFSVSLAFEPSFFCCFFFSCPCLPLSVLDFARRFALWSSPSRFIRPTSASADSEARAAWTFSRSHKCEARQVQSLYFMAEEPECSIKSG